MKVEWIDLGKKPYKECWDYQQSLFEQRLAKQGDEAKADDIVGEILTVEHPPVYTLGRSGKESNMLVDDERLRALGAEFFHIDRGGDITFHGEGQIVCYPILDLSRLGIGLRRYIELLEQSVIDTIARYGIHGERLEGATGVWICDRPTAGNGAAAAENEAVGATAAAENGTAGAARNWRKICAIGVRASRYVTMHGLALNVSTDLQWFSHINPCGFTDKGATSMERECGKPVDFESVKRLLVLNLVKNLGVDSVIKNK